MPDISASAENLQIVAGQQAQQVQPLMTIAVGDRDLQSTLALCETLAPLQLADFLAGVESVGPLPSSSYRLGVRAAPLHDLFSAEITSALRLVGVFILLAALTSCSSALISASSVPDRTSPAFSPARLRACL